MKIQDLIRELAEFDGDKEITICHNCDNDITYDIHCICEYEDEEGIVSILVE